MATLSHGTAFTWHYEAGDRRFGGGQLEVYETHPDSREQPGVPKGTVKQMPPWESKIFSGTKRDWWVYVPAQYKPETPAAVMVFQDGAGPKDYVPTVFDNLIAEGDMPVTVGIFIQPGVLRRRPGQPQLRVRHAVRSVRAVPARGDPAGSGKDREAAPRRREPRHLGSEQRRHLRLHRRVGAARTSSARCSRGSAASPTSPAARRCAKAGTTTRRWSARRPRKPIRVFLQDGANDLDNANGNWPLANQTLAKSLAFAGYDYRFEYGQGFHSNRHGRAILPDSLRWLWRDYRITDH